MSEEQEKSGFNLMGDLLGGQFLSKQRMAGQWVFILYLFFLIIAYITISLSVEKTQLTIRRNQRVMKNLKADYTAKAAKLQYLSKRDEVEIRLIKHNSKLAKPVDPAKEVKLERLRENN